GLVRGRPRRYNPAVSRRPAMIKGMPWRRLSAPNLIRKRNAQAQDQERRQEAIQGDRDRQGASRAAWQAPHDDPQDRQADPQSSRDQGAVQDGRRKRQEVLLAERLT